MPRFFNTAGPCKAEDHYMLPPEDRLPDVRDLIDNKLYFVVHAPRQVGKTTAFSHLARVLTEEGRYAALLATCETGQTAGDDVEAGVMAVIHSIESQAEIYLPEEIRPPSMNYDDITPNTRLGLLLRKWAERCPLPVVLFLDEIDALMDASLISVLRQIRGRYDNRPGSFPQSIALIGLRDVRDYKVRYRPEQNSLGTASPFNIKVESLTLRDFTADEVAKLYLQHTDETGQRFTDEALRLGYDLTGGQPWLVNALAFQITWRELRDRSVTITAAHLDAARETLIERRDTHLDSLVDKLREERVRRIIEPMLTGQRTQLDVLNDDVRYLEDLGLIRSRPMLKIANPIYQEIIPRALAWLAQIQIDQEAAWYQEESGRLNMDRLMGAFADFWVENAEPMLESQPYHEAAPHLVLLAFLQRIINSGGYIHREYAVGRGRMDLLVRWPILDGSEQREALELKVWHDKKPDPLDRGLEQLSRYLDRLSLSEGTLILFDSRTNAAKIQERTSLSACEHQGRSIRLLRA